MKFNQEQNYAGRYIINSYDPGRGITVNQKKYSTSLIITNEKIIPWRPNNLNDISPQDLEKIFQLSPRLVIYGCGESFKQPDAWIQQQFINNNFSLEAMTTRSACGTFNMLLTDKRPVMAALLLN